MDNSLRSCSREVLLDITPRYNLGTFLDVFLSLAKVSFSALLRTHLDLTLPPIISLNMS